MEAAQLGVRAGSPADQSRELQSAIDQAARARLPLVLGPGVIRCGDLRLPAGAQLIGIRGATRFVLTRGPSLISADGADALTLDGLTLDGAAMPLPQDRGLLHFTNGRSVRIIDCDIVSSGGHGIVLDAIEGEMTGSSVIAVRDGAVFSLNARGLRISGNTIRGAGNNGIMVWRSAAGDDGTFVIDNRIEDTTARSGGSGQNGNAINVFRAGNVIVRGNRIKAAAFSAVRGNAASNLQIVGNTCTAIGEVALYVEFGFEGAVIANNVVDGAALGVAVTNFNEGGRLAVVQGNVIRNLASARPAGTDPGDPAGIGIGVEADTVVTGNVVENAPNAGILLGWGSYLRDVVATGNVVRSSGVGIAVSVASGAGPALISDNLISGSRRGAIVGVNGNTAVSGDLANGSGAFIHLTIRGNRVH